MFRLMPLLLAAFVFTHPAVASDTEALRQQVFDTERAFADSMAERDFEAFRQFLSDEAIFFSGEEALRGSQQVADAWRAYFDGPRAPFSWAPRTVEVLASGTLALSTGPVYDPEGNCVATFSSIWRREANGDWKIVFDKGSPHCD
jgi:ketosteroid isomerase-like protein